MQSVNSQKRILKSGSVRNYDNFEINNLTFYLTFDQEDAIKYEMSVSLYVSLCICFLLYIWAFT